MLNPQTEPTPQTPTETIRENRFAPILICALLVFFTAGYFQNTRPGWNVNSQFALTAAIVERGTLKIDDYHARAELETGDKVLFEGHFYSDKSPVTAVLGVPALWAYQAGARVFGAEANYRSARYWTTWLTIGGSAAALAAMIALLLMRHRASPTRASLAAGLWVIATPLIGYSILFYNYAPACAMALGAYLLVDSYMGARAFCPRAAPLLAGGILLGLASWTLSTFALLAIILTIALVISASRESPSNIPKLWPWALGGIIGASGYAIYSLAIFGEITNPYRYEYDENFRTQMARGLMGAGAPDLRVLWMITFHPFRGLFTLFPITLVATIGLAILLRDRQTHRRAAVGLAFLIGLLLYNSGYFMWWGGWAYAPRHLIPTLALLPIGLLPFIRIPTDDAATSRKMANWVFFAVVAIAIIGAFANLAVISLDPQPPPGLTEEELYVAASIQEWPNPFLDMFRHVARGQTDPNWGTRLGLRGLWSLAPLAIIWIAGGILIWFTASLGTRRQP